MRLLVYSFLNFGTILKKIQFLNKAENTLLKTNSPTGEVLLRVNRNLLQVWTKDFGNRPVWVEGLTKQRGNMKTFNETYMTLDQLKPVVQMTKTLNFQIVNRAGTYNPNGNSGFHMIGKTTGKVGDKLLKFAIEFVQSFQAEKKVKTQIVADINMDNSDSNGMADTERKKSLQETLKCLKLLDVFSPLHFLRLQRLAINQNQFGPLL